MDFYTHFQSCTFHVKTNWTESAQGLRRAYLKQSKLLLVYKKISCTYIPLAHMNPLQTVEFGNSIDTHLSAGHNTVISHSIESVAPVDHCRRLSSVNGPLSLFASRSHKWRFFRPLGPTSFYCPSITLAYHRRTTSSFLTC